MFNKLTIFTNFLGSGSGKLMRIHADPVPQPWLIVLCLCSYLLPGGLLPNHALHSIQARVQILHCTVCIRTSNCGGSLVAHQTSEAVVPGSNPASSTMILGHCRFIVKYCM